MSRTAASTDSAAYQQRVRQCWHDLGETPSFGDRDRVHESLATRQRVQRLGPGNPALEEVGAGLEIAITVRQARVDAEHPRPFDDPGASERVGRAAQRGTDRNHDVRGDPVRLASTGGGHSRRERDGQCREACREACRKAGGGHAQPVSRGVPAHVAAARWRRAHRRRPCVRGSSRPSRGRRAARSRW